MADTTGDMASTGWGLEPESPDSDPWVEPATIASGPPPERAIPPRPRRWALVGALALSALIGAVTASAVLLAFDSDDTTATTLAPLGPGTATPTSPAAIVAARVIPSIVTVEVSNSNSGDFVADASGSGVVLDAAGTIVTNQHVVDGALRYQVLFADGRTYSASLVGEDALTDLAVLRVDTTGLTPIVLGSSRSMSIGDLTIAVGSPLGLEGGPSVTVGVLSAFDRRVRTSDDSELFGLLQTDAPITRGSSGGALVDGEGRLIGITSAIAVSDVGAEGLGFAIPVEMVQRITADLIADGVSPHPFLGISGSTHFETRPDGALAPAGVEVATIIENTAAALAGIAEGDIIVTFAGDPVVTMDRLVVQLRYYRVGDTVEVGLTRDGVQMTLAVMLLERPEGV